MIIVSMEINVLAMAMKQRQRGTDALIHLLMVSLHG
jgi:hypothetical protein